jgi:serine/threonine-protein kinase
MTDDLIGKRFGGYAILDLVGVGGMATVYRAHQTSMDRMVAIKILPRHFLNDETYMHRFEREVRIAAQLEHRGIVPVHDYGEFEGQPYIVMRYMPGGSVDDLLADGGMALDRLLRVVEQIAPALDFAHSKGVLHRDLKPSNVLLDEQGDAYLTDFGIARIMGETASTVTTLGVVGTPSYMSPEQAQGGALDGRSDIYSLGVMVFEMACGRRPFESDTPYGVAVKHVTEMPPMPRQFNPNLSPAVEQAILIAISKRREDRYADAVAFAESLKRAARGLLTVKDTEPSIRLKAVDSLPYTAVRQPETGYPPPPAVAATPPEFSSVTPAVRPRSQERGGIGGLIVSAGVGVLIGCGLLSALVVGALVVIANLSTAELPEDYSTDDGRSLVTVTGARDLALTPINTVSRGTTRTSAPTATGVPPGSAPAVNTESPRQEPTAPARRSPKLVYAAEDERGFNLYRLDLETGETTRLTDHPAHDIAPVVSPDGLRVAFLSKRDGNFDLYVVGIEGGRALRLVDTAYDIRAAVWSPDGERLYYTSDERGDGSSDILSVAADGSDIRLIYTDGTRCGDLAISADGQTLVFVSGEPRDATTWELRRLDLATGDVQRLTRNRDKESSPHILPDGSILYTTGGDGYSSIALMDADGGSRRVVVDSPGYDWGARLSADGMALVFTSDMSGRDVIYRLDWETPLVNGEPRPVADGMWGDLAAG